MLAAREVAAINKFALPTLLRSVARPLQARRLNAALQHHEDGAHVSADFDSLLFPTHRPISAEGQTLGDLTGRHGAATDQTYFPFRPYGPRPLVADVTHVRPAVPPR